MDVIYPLASIIVFIAYAQTKLKANWRFDAKAIVPIAAYIIVLFLISVDDISDILNLGLRLPETYWILMMWLYPIISFLTFFSYGQANEKTRE